MNCLTENMRTSHVTHGPLSSLTHFLLAHYFCHVLVSTFLQGISYASLKLEFFFLVQIICFISSKCVIINLKLLKNKICKNSPNLTHYLTTKNFCNLLKFETKTRFSNCQKVVRKFPSHL